MIRKVAFAKAVLSGAAGAVAWDLLVRALIRAGLPLLDLPYLLGTLVIGRAPFAAWWSVGVLLHAVIGAIWAVFYAYFFWSTWDLPPAIQGLLFALVVQTPLAGIVMVPELGAMHPLVLSGALPAPGLFAARFGWGGPAGLIVGHAVYGLVLGALYTRPVGYPVRRSARRRKHG